jgi:hypothetical protein
MSWAPLLLLSLSQLERSSMHIISSVQRYYYLLTVNLLLYFCFQVQDKIAVEGLKLKDFANPAYGKSHWFMPLTYHGDKEVCSIPL